MKRLNRRQILERMAAVTGGAVSLSLVNACDAGVSVPENTDGIVLKALDKTQMDLVADIADAMIPDADTPGAKAVNVHYLIDELVANWMTGEDRKNFLNDLAALEGRIKQECGSSFSELSQTDRGAVLDQLGSETQEKEDHIYLRLRQMIIFGYYTSEVGASEELAFDPIPGEYRGCIPVEEVGKTWAVSS